MHVSDESRPTGAAPSAAGSRIPQPGSNESTATPLMPATKGVCQAQAIANGEAEVPRPQSKRPRATQSRKPRGHYKKSTTRASASGAFSTARDQKFRQRKASATFDLLDHVFGDGWREHYSHKQPQSADDGQPCDRGAVTLRWVMHKMFNDYPVLWSKLLSERKTVYQAEETAMALLERHWRKNSLHLFTKGSFTQEGWQITCNLLCKVYDEAKMELVRLVLPGGAAVATLPGVHSIVKERDELAAMWGYTASDVSASYDAVTLLTRRLEYLDNVGLLTPAPRQPDHLIVQLLADATGIYGSSRTNGTVLLFKPVFDDSEQTDDCMTMQSKNNLLLLTLYSGADDYSNMVANASRSRLQVRNSTILWTPYLSATIS